MTTAYLTHPACRLHEMVSGHPESPARIAAIESSLAAAKILGRLRHVDPVMASAAQLERAHSVRHVEMIHAVAPASGLVTLDPDTSMNIHSLNAALYAAGAATKAVDLVVGGEVDNAFCNVRPPGHHAEANRPMGFCLFNSVAVAAAHALYVHGMQRVAIVDFDVHHGNGTEDIFRDEPRVLMCNTYQYPLYPNVNTPTVPGHLVNVPLRAGTGSAGFRAAVTAHWLPALARFEPELILVSAGFDAHRADPLAQLAFEEDDYSWITTLLIDIADRHCDGRLVSLLEGGYALDALAASATAHVRVLQNA